MSRRNCRLCRDEVPHLTEQCGVGVAALDRLGSSYAELERRMMTRPQRRQFYIEPSGIQREEPTLQELPEPATLQFMAEAIHQIRRNATRLQTRHIGRGYVEVDIIVDTTQITESLNRLIVSLGGAPTVDIGEVEAIVNSRGVVFAFDPATTQVSDKYSPEREAEYLDERWRQTKAESAAAVEEARQVDLNMLNEYTDRSTADGYSPLPDDLCKDYWGLTPDSDANNRDQGSPA